MTAQQQVKAHSVSVKSRFNIICAKSWKTNRRAPLSERVAGEQAARLRSERPVRPPRSATAIMWDVCVLSVWCTLVM
jgi:hypothetical protein